MRGKRETLEQGPRRQTSEKESNPPEFLPKPNDLPNQNHKNERKSKKKSDSIQKKERLWRDPHRRGRIKERANLNPEINKYGEIGIRMDLWFPVVGVLSRSLNPKYLRRQVSLELNTKFFSLLWWLRACDGVFPLQQQPHPRRYCKWTFSGSYGCGDSPRQALNHKKNPLYQETRCNLTILYTCCDFPEPKAFMTRYLLNLDYKGIRTYLNMNIHNNRYPLHLLFLCPPCSISSASRRSLTQKKQKTYKKYPCYTDKNNKRAGRDPCHEETKHSSLNSTVYSSEEDKTQNKSSEPIDKGKMDKGKGKHKTEKEVFRHKLTGIKDYIKMLKAMFICGSFCFLCAVVVLYLFSALFLNKIFALSDPIGGNAHENWELHNFNPKPVEQWKTCYSFSWNKCYTCETPYSTVVYNCMFQISCYFLNNVDPSFVTLSDWKMVLSAWV